MDSFLNPHKRYWFRRIWTTRLINLSYFLAMRCTICKNAKPDMKTECGCWYHSKCFQKNWSDCHLPCPHCSTTLGHTYQDPNSGDWIVGVFGGSFWCPCYKVSANESKIIPARNAKTIGKWKRTEGRLQSINYFRLCFNICVS